MASGRKRTPTTQRCNMYDDVDHFIYLFLAFDGCWGADPSFVVEMDDPRSCTLLVGPGLGPELSKPKAASPSSSLTSRRTDYGHHYGKASSNKCLTSGNKQLVVTSALLVVTRS